AALFSRYFRRPGSDGGKSFRGGSFRRSQSKDIRNCGRAMGIKTLFAVLVGIVLLSPATKAQPQKTFTEPAWWGQGVVFVGNWEPLVFRRRHGGNLPVNYEALYQREHTEETVLKLKAAGVNMIITHFYKTGLDTERDDVEAAKRLAELCHKHG